MITIRKDNIHDASYYNHVNQHSDIDSSNSNDGNSNGNSNRNYCNSNNDCHHHNS